MRKIARAVIPRPAALSKASLATQLEEMRQHFRLDRADRMRKRVPYDREVCRQPDVVQALDAVFARKCAYCEQVLDRYAHQVGHYRPVSNAASSANGTESPDHYAWFAYTWSNLLIICVNCSRHQRNLFPVRGEHRALPMSTWSEAGRSEEALLLDPCADDPVQHIGVRVDGEMVPLTERGMHTIGVLGLNRSELQFARKAKIAMALAWVQKEAASSMPGSEEDIPVVKGDSPFDEQSAHYGAVWIFLLALCKRIEAPGPMRYLLARSNLAAVFAYLKNADEAKLLAAINGPDDVFQPAGRMPPASFRHDLQEQPPLVAISIAHFKGIEQLEITLPPADGDRAGATMLLGENSTGKSSFLQAIAIALMSQANLGRLQLNAEDFVSRAKRSWQFDGAGALSVKLAFGDGSTVALSYDDDSNRFVVNGRKKVTVLAYGSRRIFQSHVAGAANRSLFNPMAALPDPSRWLHRLDGAQFDAVARAMGTILALRPDDKILRSDGVVLVQAHGRTAPIEHMSDGYRSLFGMASDIMRRMLEDWGNLEYARGIVLIDEIETHLHPRWKLRVMSALREAMPHVQYIATTHDPLCLRGMRNGEVRLLYRADNDEVAVLSDLPDIELLRIEQILTSDYFGLFSTAEPAQQRILSELSTLAQTSEDQLLTAQRDRRDDLLEQYGGIPAIRESRDRQIVAEALTRHLREAPPTDIVYQQSMREEAISAMMDVLKRNLQP